MNLKKIQIIKLAKKLKKVENDCACSSEAKGEVDCSYDCACSVELECNDC